MKETVIQVKADQSKVNAIRVCNAGKGISLEQELAEYVDTLYKKYVPAAVRDFIDKVDAHDKEAQREARKRPCASNSSKGGADTASNG